MIKAGADGRFEGRAMGSPLRLTLGRAMPTFAIADRWWRLVVREFETAEASMSRFRDTSELTGFNNAAGSGAVAFPSRRLRQALAAADRAHRLTDGAFDPRVLRDLDRLGYRGAPLADPEAATTAAADSSSGRVVDPHGRRGRSIERPIDLGGIGKGLTLRWAASALERAGARDVLLEAGGDLVARGNGPDEQPWRIGIEDPAGSGEPLAVVAIGDLAVATSSIRVHRWTIDRRVVHHILDPRTGEPANGGLQAVTVAGPDAAWAEVWSKVLFIGGRTDVAARARARGLTAWWVTDDGTLEMTAPARALTMWVAAEAGQTA